MNKLDDWQRTCEDHEERYRAVREEMATLDDSLACAEAGWPRKEQLSWRNGPKRLNNGCQSSPRGSAYCGTR